MEQKRQDEVLKDLGSKLQDVLQQITALAADGRVATRIRILTTTYGNVTEARALDELARLPGCEVRVSLDGRRTRLHAKAWLFHRKTGFGSAYVGSANLSGAALTGGLEWTVKLTQRAQVALFARAIAHFETLWEDNEFQRYDMSEYGEKHSVSRLIGAPPGYVGFEQGGLLVDAVRQHPYSVVLLDEVEKAHPDLMSILLQVMDSATLTDNNGRKADFRQVTVIMTSNAGSREMSQATIGFAGDHEQDTKARGKQALERFFTPEFRNRLDAIVTFKPLSPEVMETIVDKFVMELEAQLRERKVAIDLRPEARSHLAKKGFDPVYGARPLNRLVQTEVRNPLTDEILFGKLEHGGTVHVGCDGEKLTFEYDSAPAPGDAPPAPPAASTAPSGGGDAGMASMGGMGAGAPSVGMPMSTAEFTSDVTAFVISVAGFKLNILFKHILYKLRGTVPHHAEIINRFFHFIKRLY